MPSFRPIRLNLNFPSSLKTVGFGLIVAISIGVSWIEYRATEELEEAKDWVAHTHEVLQRLEAVVSDIKDVQTGQQAYMLYGQAALLQPYAAGLKAVVGDIRILKYLTQDNPIQQQRLDRLESLVSRRLTIARTLIETRRRQGLEASKQVDQSSSSQQTMDNIRWLIGVMKQTEEQLLEQRSRKAKTDREAAHRLALAGLGLNLVILLGLSALINREMIARQQAAVTLEQRNQELQNTVTQKEQAMHALQASEAQLKDYADKLADSNEELGRFAYVASHDLKAPLRTIGTRLGFLLKSLGTPSQAVRQQSERIILALARMEQLLNDLLAYSRVDTQAKELVPLDTQQVIALVLESLESLKQETQAVVQVQPDLPIVWADSTQLGQVFQNLISNGIKFCQAQPKITISVTCQAQECTFCVADNGIGIAGQYQQRIFEVFQRLHGQSEYEGSGIGLAIVKKLIQRHGGRIWVESELGQGSNFFFTLKEAKNES